MVQTHSTSDRRDARRANDPTFEAGERRLDVVKVQRTCVHDGPGLRTTVFFRGCGLRCAWCQNPEMLGPRPASEPGVPLAEVVEVATRDRAYYQRTGGGVTLSGGDPLLQRPSDLAPLLQALRAEGLHVAVETALHVPWEHVEALLPLVDLFLVDLKVVGDDVAHKRCTGHSGRRVRDNVQRLIAAGAPVRFRMVVVPGWNDAPGHLDAAASFLASIGHHELELLPYHSLYEDKAHRLGLASTPLGIPHEQAVAALQAAREHLERQGVRVRSTEHDAPRRKAVFPPRVTAVRDAIRSSPYSVCLEAARLKTQYYRRHGFDRPSPIHRAERLAYVLARKSLHVWPDELLVGTFTSKRRGCQTWEEHSGTLLASIFHQLDRQAPLPFACTRRDKVDFYTRIAPFWWRHALLTRVLSTPRDFLASLSRSCEMSTGFNNNMASVAHFVVNYRRLLELGTTGLIREIEARRAQADEAASDFYTGAVIALRGLETYADRYAQHLCGLATREADPARRAELRQMEAVCRRVPRHPAASYHEALQSMLFLHLALCLESFENAVSPGRLDQVLFPYYQRDVAAGRLDAERARELLALFVLKLDEAFLVNDGDTFLRVGRLFETMSTDQTITLGGLDRDGNDATNDLTWALLDICELQPYAANMTARIHPGSPPEYLERLAEVYLNGAPMPALYNDTLYLDTLQRHYDTTPEDARDYAIIGCVEPNASDDHYGNTDCANLNVVLPFLQALRGDERDLWNVDLPDQVERIATKLVDYHLGDRAGLVGRLATGYRRARSAYLRARAPRLAPPASMAELLTRYQRRLNALANAVLADHQRIEAAIARDFPTPLASSLSRGCVDRGRDLNQGGAAFNSSGIQAVGITDVADSLHALDQVVFRQGRFPLSDVLAAMERDFQGPADDVLHQALLAVPKFGDDRSGDAAAWVNRTLQIYTAALAQVPGCPRDGRYSAGYYALNVSDVYGKKTPALPSGRRAGVPLANSVTPHYGMASGDLLSALNAVADVDFAAHAPNGTTVTFTIDAGLFPGSEGVANLAGIFQTFFQQGGMQFQPNVIDRAVLLDAYEHPERHPDLLVRVAGYCAYFNHLSDDLKRIIINRTCYA